MPHPLVARLRFARSEFARCLEGLDDADARRKLEPMNCISWMVGHLAVQEQTYWVVLAQQERLHPNLHKLTGYGSEPNTPPLAEMLNAWSDITAAADRFLDQIGDDSLTDYFSWKGERRGESIGTMLLRNTYHYWFHCGEAHAVRQMLGHANLGDFVGDMTSIAYELEV